MTNAYCLEQPVRLRQYHHHGHNRNHHYDYYNHFEYRKRQSTRGTPSSPTSSLQFPEQALAVFITGNDDDADDGSGYSR